MYTKLICVNRCWSTSSTCLGDKHMFCTCRPGAHIAELHPKNTGKRNIEVSSWWKLTSVHYYNSFVLKKCCLTTHLNYFQLSLFTLNVCVWLGFFGCCAVFHLGWGLGGCWLFGFFWVFFGGCLGGFLGFFCLVVCFFFPCVFGVFSFFTLKERLLGKRET